MRFDLVVWRRRNAPLARSGLCLVLFLVGCQRCDRGVAGTTGEVAGGQGAEGTEQPAPDEAHEAAPEAPAPEGVRLAGEPGRYREVAVVLEAHGPATVRIRRDLAVERRTASGVEPVTATGITLRPSCDAEAPECIELAPGAELRPPPWTGELGAAQCGCERCAEAPPGEYRFVATSCEGGHRVEGAWFTLGE